MLIQMMVVVALQAEGAEEALTLHPSPTITVFTGASLISIIQPVSRMLEK